MRLTDTAAKKAKPTEKPYKLSDGGGMFLLVNPNGSKWWRLKYRIAGKEKLISLGTYPEVSLKEARERRDSARKLKSDGVDPSQHRRAQKAAHADMAANSFEVVTREWIDKHSSLWASSHASKLARLFERDVFPWLGDKPVATISAPDLLAVARRIEARGALDTAHRAIGNCGQVFRYAIATGRCDRDPSGDLRGALPPARGGHFAATLEPARLGEILRAMDGYRGSIIVRCALRLAPLVFVRPGELRRARWSEIDLDSAEWRFQATKTKTPHIVPLSRQAIEVLREIQPLTGQGTYVFPGARDLQRPMSDNALLVALRSMDIGKDEMTIHGFRAVARTLADEKLNIRPDFLEHQLAHAVRDPNGRAYNRTAHLRERHKMMQCWADYLDNVRTGAEVLKFGQPARKSST